MFLPCKLDGFTGHPTAGEKVPRPVFPDRVHDTSLAAEEHTIENPGRACPREEEFPANGLREMPVSQRGAGSSRFAFLNPIDRPLFEIVISKMRPFRIALRRPGVQVFLQRFHTIVIFRPERRTEELIRHGPVDPPQTRSSADGAPSFCDYQYRSDPDAACGDANPFRNTPGHCPLADFPRSARVPGGTATHRFAVPP